MRPVASAGRRQYHFRTMPNEFESETAGIQDPAVAHGARRSPGRSDGRPWPVKALTLLLAVQGLGLVVLGLLSVDHTAGLWGILIDQSFYATLPPLGVLSLVAAAGFLRVRPGAWVMAMLVQALSLLVALIFYFRYQPQDLLIYGMMVYALIMVLYLNYAEVPTLFRAQPGEEERR